MSALNRLCIEALLDDDRETLSKLPGIVKLALGSVCPQCSSADVQWSGREEDDAFCETCEEWFSPSDKATEAYEAARLDREFRLQKPSLRRRKR
jgi:hypothetical protein